MPNTTNGYPYPAQTDPVAQGATAIQALAQAVDDRVGGAASGAAAIAHAAAIAGSTSITFPAGRFSAAPGVAMIACKDSGGGPPWSGLVVVWTTGHTAAGMTLNSRSISGAAITATIQVAWSAKTVG